MRIIVAAVLTTASLMAQIAGGIDPYVDSAGFHWFELGETKPEVVRRLGVPKLTAPFGADFEAWQFQIGETEEGEFSHHAVFRTPDNRLVSIARDYTEPTVVDAYFPVAETRTYTGPSAWNIRVRILGGGRYLLAMGVSGPGDKTTQIVLLDDFALRAFYPWLHLKLTTARKWLSSANLEA